MKRLINRHLLEWKTDSSRTPLLIRGARQIGKTYAVQQLGKTYEQFVEVNFELQPKLINIFEQDLLPERIIKELNTELNVTIDPQNTLLFFDEVQAAPKAIIALRYFYEKMPELHVIAAGSLLDFAIKEVGIPVGRVSFLHMYPLSFLEFLWAMGNEKLLEALMQTTIHTPLSNNSHEKLLAILGEYLAIGGMPKAVKEWRETKSFVKCSKIFSRIINAYQQDFNKYAKKLQLKYVSALFNKCPRFLRQKFKFSNISQEFRKRELAPCLDLLNTAGIIHYAYNTAANGIPLGAEIDFDHFKIVFLDVALSQKILNLKAGGDWIMDPLEQFINKGELVESFVGQELLAYANPIEKENLHYWQRQTRGSEAEVDYVIQKESDIIPIEVKSGAGTTLKSMHMFLESHPQSPYGIRFSTQNYSVHDKIHSYPLYAVAKAIQQDDDQFLLL